MSDSLHAPSLSPQASNPATTSELTAQESELHREEGNFSGSQIHSTTSPREAEKIRESALDQFMQVLGNPLKAITSIPDQIKSALERRELLAKLEVEKGAFAQLYDSYAHRGLEKEFNNLIEAYDKALETQLAPESYEALQRCKEETFSALDQAVQKNRIRMRLEYIAEQKNSHLRMKEIYLRCGLREPFENFIQACNIILTANAINDEMNGAFKACEKELTNAYANIEAAERNNAIREYEQRALGTPGAFKVTAAEAAAQGIHQPSDALRAIIEPEATPIAVAMPIANHIAAQTAKTPKNPHGYPVVKAEIGTPADIEIPADHVVNLMTQDQMEKLIAERNAEITKDHSQIIAP